MTDTTQPAMPAALAAILQEDCWHREKFDENPMGWFFLVTNRMRVQTGYCFNAENWYVNVEHDDGYAEADDIYRAADLMRRIEAALAPDGPDLREVIARAAYVAVTDKGTEGWMPVADAILGAIAEAGMVIVDAEKMAMVIAQLASAERDRDSSGMVRAWKTISEMLELDRTGGRDGE